MTSVILKGEIKVASNRKIHSVSFSLSDPFEQKLLKHAEQNGAFSTYIKRLIQRDMEKGVRVIPSNSKEKTGGNTTGNTISMGSLTGVFLSQ